MSIQAIIGRWHVECFGALGDQEACVRKFAEEAAEFAANPSGEEAADCVIVLLAWAHRQGIDLMGAVRTKFDIVRQRDQLARDIAKGIVRPVPAGLDVLAKEQMVVNDGS